MGKHIVLLGDSIFDNQAYTRGEPDVISHLNNILPSGWQATLAAKDGCTTNSLHYQLTGIPNDATHLVVSIGGNDALESSYLLMQPVNSIGEALNVIYEQIQRFEQDYSRAIRRVIEFKLPLTVCTIYNGNFQDPREARIKQTALKMFNDVVLRQAIENRLQVIDLRTVCTEEQDYANEIEPSGQGGYKIATAIAHAVGAMDASTKKNEIWGI
jgi:hypothetical protein